MTTKVEPTVEKWRKKIEKLGNDVMRGNKIECKCPTCGDRAYGYDTEIKAKDSWIFVELSSLYERLLSHITEPTHSLISKIPSAYGVGSANLSEGDIEKKFYEDLADNEWILDDPYSPDMVQMPFHELEKRVHNLLSHSVQEAKAEERKEMITKLHNIRSKIHGYISLVELTDLLSSLNTKASLKQEEEK